MSEVSPETRDLLHEIAAGNPAVVAEELGPGGRDAAPATLDARSVELVKIAALVALDGPPAAYAEQVASAIEGGVSGDEVVEVLRAVAPQIGGPRVVAAAPELMLALGLSLSGERPAPE